VEEARASGMAATGDGAGGVVEWTDGAPGRVSWTWCRRLLVMSLASQWKVVVTQHGRTMVSVWRHVHERMTAGRHRRESRAVASRHGRVVRLLVSLHGRMARMLGPRRGWALRVSAARRGRASKFPLRMIRHAEEGPWQLTG
jgi:hypothetical protein